MFVVLVQQVWNLVCQVCKFYRKVRSRLEGFIGTMLRRCKIWNVPRVGNAVLWRHIHNINVKVLRGEIGNASVQVLKQYQKLALQDMFLKHMPSNHCYIFLIEVVRISYFRLGLLAGVFPPKLSFKWAVLILHPILHFIIVKTVNTDS